MDDFWGEEKSTRSALEKMNYSFNSHIGGWGEWEQRTGQEKNRKILLLIHPFLQFKVCSLLRLHTLGFHVLIPDISIQGGNWWKKYSRCLKIAEG